jgi:hypothetical protein
MSQDTYAAPYIAHDSMNLELSFEFTFHSLFGHGKRHFWLIASLELLPHDFLSVSPVWSINRIRASIEKKEKGWKGNILSAAAVHDANQFDRWHAFSLLFWQTRSIQSSSLGNRVHVCNEAVR